MSLKEWLLMQTRGGVHAPHCKHTAECETIVMPPPERVIIAMSQHIGAPCTPTVKVGDTVLVGQVVGDSDKPVSAPIHSGVSGKVTAISELLLPDGKKTDAVVIESDGEQRIHQSVKPPVVESYDDFIKAVRQSGLVGLGGAGFPTHIKLQPKDLDKVDTIIINAAECEPYITSDYRECMEYPQDIISGALTVMEYLNADRVIIAVERNKPAAITELSKIAAEVTRPGHEVFVKSLPARYPQGAEKVLIKTCTGRIVPKGKLPADVGCIVMNVNSIAFLARYLKTGMPLVDKRLTVDGSAISHPKNVRAVIGTPIRDVIEFSGGTKNKIRKLLMGGPMMGIALMDDGLPVLKQNNAIIAMTEDDVTINEPSACIRCGRCVKACPMNLAPPTIEAAYMTDDTGLQEKLGVTTCMECGCCSYVCPASRRIVQTMRLSKQAVSKSKSKS
ncbi:MAG: electron transport complex subunit RsxC [Oscillospiraceae bacterium]|nr:electron transport complex subunit RsxC [Oscillospiraceae bacterium]MDD4414276.1 electron transport complex subunit RsxC [Oscillospiraceae bacterium]